MTGPVHRCVASPQGGGHWNDKPVLPCEPGSQIIVHACNLSVFELGLAESELGLLQIVS